MRLRVLLSLLAGLVLLSAPEAGARPYRVMVTRTAETTRAGNLELGLRYQGFFSMASGSLPYQQLSPSLRFGLLDNLEVNLHLEVLALGMPDQSSFQVAFGDIPVGLQWTFLETRPFAMGVYLRGTLPTGPSTLDIVHPALSDGTWDGEGTLLMEVRPIRELRFMFNGGYLYQGVRARGSLPDFDVPDAVQASAAVALNPDPLTLIGVELVGRHYLRPDITPVWTNNPTQVEVIPVLRREVSPGLVLEAVAGISLTPDLSEIYQFRALIGGTYEFDLASGPNLPERERRPSRPRRR